MEIGPNNLYKFINRKFGIAYAVCYLQLTFECADDYQQIKPQSNSQNASPRTADQPSGARMVDSHDASSAHSGGSTSGEVVVPVVMSSNALAMGLLSVPLLFVLIYSVYTCACRKEGRVSYFSTNGFGLFRAKRNDHFDLGRLLSDPEKSVRTKRCKSEQLR